MFILRYCVYGFFLYKIIDFLLSLDDTHPQIEESPQNFCHYDNYNEFIPNIIFVISL